MFIGDIAIAVEKPKKIQEKLAIFLPGYLDSKDYAHLKSLSVEFSKIGYLSVRLDPIGTWESKGNIKDYSVSSYLNNVKSIINYFQKEYKNQFSEIILVAHSLGGQIAALYASKHPEISAIVGIMPSPGITSVNSVQRALPKWREDGYKLSTRDVPDNSNKLKHFKVPYSFIDDRSKFDAARAIKGFHGITLLITGDLDATVPPAQVRELYRAANQPKKLIELAGIGHGYRRNAEEVSLVNLKIMQSFKKLKGNNG